MCYVLNIFTVLFYHVFTRHERTSASSRAGFGHIHFDFDPTQSKSHATALEMW